MNASVFPQRNENNHTMVFDKFAIVCTLRVLGVAFAVKGHYFCRVLEGKMLKGKFKDLTSLDSSPGILHKKNMLPNTTAYFKEIQTDQKEVIRRRKKIQ